jgi:hypothetical protein
MFSTPRPRLFIHRCSGWPSRRPRRCCRHPARQGSPAGSISRTRLANQGDGLRRFDNQLNSGKDGKLMLSLTDGLLKMMNFKYVFRWHLPFLFLIFCLPRHGRRQAIGSWR